MASIATRVFRWVSAGTVMLVLLAIGAWKIADSRSFQLFGTLVHRVETRDSVVALTFDDGPTPEGTDSILAILAREGVRATFFFVGQDLAANPGLAERYVAAGHELGNHSYTHRRMVLKSQRFIRREIEATDSLLRRAGETAPIHFRPPYGKKLVGLPWYLERTHRTNVMWDVEPDSYSEVAANAERIVEHVSEEVRPGSIVILHVMFPSRAESLRSVSGIVRRLQARGYRFVTISELIALR